MEVAIREADLEDRGQAEALLRLIDAYARAPAANRRRSAPRREPDWRPA